MTRYCRHCGRRIYSLAARDSHGNRVWVHEPQRAGRNPYDHKPEPEDPN